MGILHRRHENYFALRIDWELHIPLHARFFNGLGTLFICLSWLPLILVAKFQTPVALVIAAILLLGEMVEHFGDNRFFNHYLDLRKHDFIVKVIYVKFWLAFVYLALFVYLLVV